MNGPTLYQRVTFHHYISTWKHLWAAATFALLLKLGIGSWGTVVTALVCAPIISWLTLFLGQESTFKARDVFKLAEVGMLVQAIVFFAFGALLFWPLTYFTMPWPIIEALRSSALMILLYVIIALYTGFLKSTYGDRSWLPVTWKAWREAKAKQKKDDKPSDKTDNSNKKDG